MASGEADFAEFGSLGATVADHHDVASLDGVVGLGRGVVGQMFEAV